MEIKVILHKNPFYSNSASSNRWLTLIQGLQKNGVDLQMIIVGAYSSPHEKLLEGNGLSQVNLNLKYLSERVVKGIWSLRYEKYFGGYISFFRTKSRVLKELKRFEGIVWVENDLMILRIVSSLPRKSFKSFSEMSEFLDIHRYNKGNFLQRFIADRRQRLFEREVFPILDGLALMTKTLLSHYKSFPEPQPKMLHLPMTVDLDRFEQIAPAPGEFRQPYIAFVGVMNDAKDGVSNLIKAFNLIKNQFLEYKVYLVGSWNYDTPIHLELIKSYGLEDRVFWMKEYSRDAIPSIIGNADLLVLPRPDSKQAQGGFPTKLGEYLATGKPVCATTVGELPDYLTDNESVFFAQPGSVESFADAMRLALSDPENARRVGLNGKRVAQKEFNKDIQAKKLHQFLLELQDEKK